MRNKGFFRERETVSNLLVLAGYGILAVYSAECQNYTPFLRRSRSKQTPMVLCVLTDDIKFNSEMRQAMVRQLSTNCFEEKAITCGPWQLEHPRP